MSRDTRYVKRQAKSDGYRHKKKMTLFQGQLFSAQHILKHNRLLSKGVYWIGFSYFVQFNTSKIN